MSTLDDISKKLSSIDRWANLAMVNDSINKKIQGPLSNILFNLDKHRINYYPKSLGFLNNVSPLNDLSGIQFHKQALWQNTLSKIHDPIHISSFQDSWKNLNNLNAIMSFTPALPSRFDSSKWVAMSGLMNTLFVSQLDQISKTGNWNYYKNINDFIEETKAIVQTRVIEKETVTKEDLKDFKDEIFSIVEKVKLSSVKNGLNTTKIDRVMTILAFLFSVFTFFEGKLQMSNEELAQIIIAQQNRTEQIIQVTDAETRERVTEEVINIILSAKITRINTQIFASPKRKSRCFGTLQKGQRVFIVSSRGKWVQVTSVLTHNQEQVTGWVLKKHLERMQ